MSRLLRFLVRWGSALAAAGAAGAALLGLAGGVSPYVDIINHFAPQWLIAGLAAALVGATAWRGAARRVVVGLAAVAVVVGGVRVVPEWVARFAPRPAPSGERLKVIQFNAYLRNVSPAQSVDWLLAEDADIVVIEEGEGLPRSEMLRLRRRYPYCNGCPATGYWSNMILAKRPALAEGRFERPRPDTIFPILGGWSRFALSGGGEFTVVGVHMAWPWKAYSARQHAALAEFVNRGWKDRLIVSGDFNMTPWSSGLRRLDGMLGLPRVTHGQASWPGQAYYRAPSLPTLPFPYLPIDQVYAGEGWTPVSVRRGPRLGSDHYPIVVELAARP